MPSMPQNVTWHLPIADAETAPYWEAATERKLLIKECRACGNLFFYPRSSCPRCWSIDTAWKEASGRGTVYTYTVIMQNDLPPFRDRIPYVVAIVELEEGVRMTSNIVDCAPSDVRCGMPVRVSFRQEESVSIPVFVPSS